MKVLASSLLFTACAAVVTKKAGLSFVDSTCDDANALGLGDSWYYNWNVRPEARGPICDTPRAAEFVPMLWSCDPQYCGKEHGPGALPEDYHSEWLRHNVKYLLGFNEPDNMNQANMTPEVAAQSWIGVQKVAARFNPPLELVSPAMTHWSEDGTPWLDEFFGNCTELPGCQPDLIKYVAFHDYGGDATDLMKKAEGSYKKYGRKIWLTEYSVGSCEHRAAQDAFLKKIVPQLEASESIFRHAWYSTRNAPDDPDASCWVAESALLPAPQGSWKKRAHHGCLDSELKWLSGASWQPGTLAQCGAKALGDPDCASPLTMVYQLGGDSNCYCAISDCTLDTREEFSDRYVYTPASYNQISGKVCSSEDRMLWLNSGAESTLEGCQAMAELTGECAHPKTIAFQTGDEHNCYCNRYDTCDKTDSDWLDLHVRQGDEMDAVSTTPTSTGRLYAQHTAKALIV